MDKPPVTPVAASSIGDGLFDRPRGPWACSTVGPPGTVQSPTRIDLGGPTGSRSDGADRVADPLAQATGSSPGPGSLAPLALRRWFSSLTLSSPEPVPSFSGLWWGLAGLAALLVVAIVLQGPVRALGQLFDLPGHVRLVSEALGRLRRSSRVVVVTIGATVLAWTASQTASYNRPQGKDDLILLTKSRSLGDLAVEGGIMAGLTPLRDVAGLGDNLPLLVAAAILAFQAATRRWGGLAPRPAAPRVDRGGESSSAEAPRCMPCTGSRRC